MNILKFCLVITLLAGTAVPAFAEQNAPGVIAAKSDSIGSNRSGTEVRRIELDIAADRNKIIGERELIAADRKKIKEAARLTDKKAAAQAAQEMNKDIKTREAVIKDLKRDISDKKTQKNHIVYGDQVIPRRNLEVK